MSALSSKIETWSVFLTSFTDYILQRKFEASSVALSALLKFDWLVISTAARLCRFATETENKKPTSS